MAIKKFSEECCIHSNQDIINIKRLESLIIHSLFCKIINKDDIMYDRNKIIKICGLENKNNIFTINEVKPQKYSSLSRKYSSIRSGNSSINSSDIRSELYPIENKPLNEKFYIEEGSLFFNLINKLKVGN